MDEFKKELTVTINWEIERYKYSPTFSLERIGLFMSSLSYKREKLDKPNYLFKHYGRSPNSLNSLLENYLYFSSPKYFNDPFDCLINREKYIMKGSKEIQNHRENIGVCCFTIVNNNPLMWGHYSNSFSGFCLKFKNKNLLKNENVAIKSHVAYLKNYKPLNDNFKKTIDDLKTFNLKKESEETIHKISAVLSEYTWKYYDWKYEQEYRAISLNANSFNRRFHFDKNDVEEIYIGHLMKDIDPDYFDSLMKILKDNYPHIKIFEVKPHPLIVKLDFIPVDNF